MSIVSVDPSIWLLIYFANFFGGFYHSSFAERILRSSWKVRVKFDYYVNNTRCKEGALYFGLTFEQ